MKKMKTNLIYGLMDPRNDVFYYIGKTTIGNGRPLTHLKRSHNEMVRKWVSELECIGLSPSIHIIEKDIELKELRNREIYWINEYRKINDELFNVCLIDDNELRTMIHIGNANEVEFILNNFDLVCKSIRCNIGLSQDEFSEMLNISRSTLSIIERGGRNVLFGTVLDIFKIAFLGVDEYKNELNIKIYEKAERVRSSTTNK